MAFTVTEDQLTDYLCEHGCRNGGGGRVSEARALARQMLAAPLLLDELRKLEWSFAGACPVCGAHFRGHRPGCSLGAAIAVTEGG